MNSDGFAPPDVSDPIVSVAPPEFLTVAVKALLVRPTGMPPKLKAVGASVATAAVVLLTVAASCDTMNVAPPIDTSPIDRLALRAAPVLTPTTYATVAPPVPLVAEDTVSQDDALLLADQVHPAAVESTVVPEPPAAVLLALVGLKLYVQPDAWLTVKD